MLWKHIGFKYIEFVGLVVGVTENQPKIIAFVLFRWGVRDWRLNNAEAFQKAAIMRVSIYIVSISAFAINIVITTLKFYLYFPSGSSSHDCTQSHMWCVISF